LKISNQKEKSQNFFRCREVFSVKTWNGHETDDYKIYQEAYNISENRAYTSKSIRVSKKEEAFYGISYDDSDTGLMELYKRGYNMNRKWVRYFALAGDIGK